MNSSSSSSSRSGAQKLEDVPELIHQIQSRLPVKAAARTSILSKSWLHGWSTTPHLRFHHVPTICNEQGRNDFKLVDHTLMRYVDDNIPIETFNLAIEIDNLESAFLAENWLLLLAIKTRVKVLSLTIPCSATLNFPIEILSSESITQLRVATDSWGTDQSVSMTASHDPVIIKCVSLRKLHLVGLRISEEILDGILSSCSSLEKIELSYCSHDLNTIKVKNLPCLYQLIIYTDDQDSTDFVISHLPNLRYFCCNVGDCDDMVVDPRPFNAHSISLGSSVTELSLRGLIKDKASLDMIKSGLPLLSSLTLDMESWMLGSFHFTSASIKSLTLLSWSKTLVDVQVHAPKLTFFRFDGKALPNLLFPISNVKLICLRLNIDMPVDASFFVKMRETISLARKCYIDMTTRKCKLSVDIDINDLRTKLLLPPASNVQELRFGTFEDECLWERSPFFDAFFEICHPKYVFAKPDMSFKHNNHFCKLMIMEVLEKNKTATGTVCWPDYLENVEIEWPGHENWKTLTNSHRSLIDGSTPGVYMNFKLMWR